MHVVNYIVPGCEYNNYVYTCFSLSLSLSDPPKCNAQNNMHH